MFGQVSETAEHGGVGTVRESRSGAGCNSRGCPIGCYDVAALAASEPAPKLDAGWHLSWRRGGNLKVMRKDARSECLSRVR